MYHSCFHPLRIPWPRLQLLLASYRALAFRVGIVVTTAAAGLVASISLDVHVRLEVDLEKMISTSLFTYMTLFWTSAHYIDVFPLLNAMCTFLLVFRSRIYRFGYEIPVVFCA